MSAPPVDGFIEQDARGVVSGWRAEPERLFGRPRGEATGTDGYLSKPIEPRSLDAAVEG